MTKYRGGILQLFFEHPVRLLVGRLVFVRGGLRRDLLFQSRRQGFSINFLLSSQHNSILAVRERVLLRTESRAERLIRKSKNWPTHLKSSVKDVAPEFWRIGIDAVGFKVLTVSVRSILNPFSSVDSLKMSVNFRSKVYTHLFSLAKLPPTFSMSSLISDASTELFDSLSRSMDSGWDEMKTRKKSVNGRFGFSKLMMILLFSGHFF